MDLAKMSMTELQNLRDDLDGQLEGKILERNKITRELSTCDGMFREAKRDGRRSEADDLMEKCREAGTDQNRLNVEIRDLWNKILPIREAMIAIRFPVT